MTDHESECIKNLAKQINLLDRQFGKELAELRGEVHSAAEVREIVRDDMKGLSGRMTWLLALIIAMITTVAYNTFQNEQLKSDVSENALKIERAIRLEQAD